VSRAAAVRFNCLVGQVARLGVEGSRDDDRNLQSSHGPDLANDFAQHAGIQIGERALLAELLFQGGQFGLVREPQVPEQERDLFEG